MTREEAISRLKEGEPFSEIHDPVWDEALKMAISALSAELYLKVDDYENQIADLHNRLDIAEYDKERYKEKITILEAENKGEWIAQDIHNCHTNFKCSECGYIHDFMHLYGKPTADYTYCPNCGAKMQEVEE